MNKFKLIVFSITALLGIVHARAQIFVTDTLLVNRVVTDTIFVTKALPDSTFLPKALPDTLHLTPAYLDAFYKNKKIEHFDHDIESSVFIPKGQWIFGVSFSYSQSNQDRYQFFIFEDISANMYSFKVSPMVAYAFKNDMAAGMKFSYTRALTKLSNTDLVVDSETEMNMDHVYSLSHNYYATALFRNYFSLGTSQRFGFFNEVQLELGGGQSKLTRGVGNSLTGTYERNFSVDVGLVPGLIMFLSNWSAIEVNVGVLGFSYRHTKSITDQIYHSHRKAASANFRINLFSITFGTTFYI